MSEQTSEENVLSRKMEILRNARNALQELENSVTGSTSGEHEQYFINSDRTARLSRACLEFSLSFALTSISLRDLPLLYEIRGGSL